MEKWLAAAGFLALALALLEHWRTRRTQIRLGRMLERAMEEDFTETEFSESLLSALETRMAQYLSASALSARNLREERNKITSLIADVSHQTKTPVANLLLYAQPGGAAEVPVGVAGEVLPAGDGDFDPAPAAGAPSAGD